MAGGCFLIGSGPSLRDIKVSRLAQLDTISFNRSYIAWQQWGFVPTFYACLDPVALEDNALEIRGLIERYSATTRFFLPGSARDYGINSSARVSLVRIVPGQAFSTDISGLTDFGNVGATSIQLLALLGYRRIGLVGVDARYDPLVGTEAVALVGKDEFVMVDDDPNHFCSEYAKGKRVYVCPDLKKILGQWPLVADECEKNNIEVRNASPGSALDCFSMTDFAGAIEWVIGD